MSKSFNARIKSKHDVEANWKKATNFIPYEGEIIIYDSDNTHTASRFKVGNGNTKVNDLPFSGGDIPLVVEVDDDGYATHTPVQMLEHIQNGGNVYFQGQGLSYIDESTAHFNYIGDDAIIGVCVIDENRSCTWYDYSIITNENFSGYMQDCYGMSAQDNNHQVTFISRDLQMNNHAIIGLAYTNDEYDDSAVTVAYAKDNLVQRETDLDNVPSFGADDNGFYGKVYIATENGDKTIPAFTRNDYDTLVVRGSDGNFQISDPTLSQHAATKQYVDNAVANVVAKSHILLEDSVTGTIYKLSVADGKLTMEVAE